MSNFVKILSGMGVLIAVYLIVAHGNESARIISSAGQTVNSGVKTLQGR